jgi:hypothetical protein
VGKHRFQWREVRKPFCPPGQWAGDDELEGSGELQRDVTEQAETVP